jgi:SAM-dependent methyltransferase
MHGAGFCSQEPPNRRALDVGAGCGHFLHLLRGFFQFDVFGLEPSEWARRYASETFGIDNLRAESTPREANMPDNHFGLLILSHTLEHVPDALGLLKDVYRVGAPGAVFYGEVPDSDYFKDWHFPEHRWFFNEPSLDFHLRCAGFEVLRIFRGRALPWPEALPLLSWLARKPADD